MASSSHQTLGHLNQVRDSSSLGNNIRRGFSTAQMCLKRILEIISSVPPCESEEEEEDKELSDPKEEEVEVEVDNKDERNAEFGSETLPFKRKAYDGSISSSSSDCLDLLVEAAKLISANTGDDEEEEEEEKESKKKKKESRMVMGEGSAVVRSKRGRNQALPSRLRDSVLEPWIRLPPRPPHSHRSTQQTTTTTRRRRSS